MNRFRLVYTVVSLVVFSLVLIFVSYAFLESQATNSSIAGEIYEAQVEFNGSDDVVISDIGPVLDYRDGVLVEFSINNGGGISYSSGTFDVKLDINSLSSNVLLCEDLKYKVLKSNDNVDYTEIGSGNFDNYSVGGNNLMMVGSDLLYGTTYYRVYIYMDGTKPNSVNLMGITLEGKVLVDIYVTGRQNLPQLVDGETFNSYIDDAITSIVFTDIEAPEGATLMGVNSKTIEPKSVTFMDFKVSNNADLVDVVETSENVIIDVSKEGDGSIVSWVEGTIMYVSSQKTGSQIVISDCKKMFEGKSNITSVDLSMLNTSNVTDMTKMFNGCSGLTELDVSGFDTSNVTYMNYMFYGCSSLIILDLSSFDTSKVINMLSMFQGCSGLTSLDVSSFDTSSLKTMNFMFLNCSKLTELDISAFDTSKVTFMVGVFGGCSGLTSLDVSSFDTSKVTNMGDMFYGCSGLTSLDVSEFDTGKVTDMSSMFYGCSGLTSLDVSGFDTSKVTNMGDMFYGCSSLTSLNLIGFDVSLVTNMYRMFCSCSSLTTLNLSGFNTSNVVSMSGMFSGCNGLTSLDISGFVTKKVTTMRSIFYGCSSLTSLDVGSFDTGNVIDMWGMFYNCSSLTSLDVSSFDTSKVTGMNVMFYLCGSLTSLGLNGFDTSEVTGMSMMFSGCGSLTELDVSSFNTSKVTDMFSMFSGCGSLTSLDLSGFDISNVTNAGYMFDGCLKLKTEITIRGNATSYGYMFRNAATDSGAEIKVNYIADTLSTVNAMINTKSNGSNVVLGSQLPRMVDGSTFNSYIVDTVTSIIFTDVTVPTGVTTTDVSVNGDGSVVSWMDGTTMYVSSQISGIEIINSNCNGMFLNKNNLVNIDLDMLDTSKVADMSYMFSGCSSLTGINFGDYFKTYNVTNMSYMFNNCSSLSLDCSSWDVDLVTLYNDFNNNASGVTAPTWVN